MAQAYRRLTSPPGALDSGRRTPASAAGRLQPVTATVDCGRFMAKEAPADTTNALRERFVR